MRLSMLAGFFLCAVPACAQDKDCTSCDDKEVEAKIKVLREEINLLNLINGLHLSVHQCAHLLQAARKADALRKAAEPKRDAAAALRYESVLKRIAAYTDMGANPPEALVREAARQRGKLTKVNPGARQKMMREMGRLTREAEAILFDPQKEILIDYKPCLIPPKDLKDPVRVGQAATTGPAEHLLTLLRRVPSNVYGQRKDDIVERTIARSEKQHGKFTPEERVGAKRKLGEILDRVRAMSDADFELSKGDVAKELAFLNKAEELFKRVTELAGEENVLKAKIRQNFLHPRASTILAVRLKQLKAWQQGKPVDLDKVSAAPSCKDGKCAVGD